MKLSSLQDLYMEELKDMYNAENQILKALPKMAKAASSPELEQAFREHLEQTKEQVERLDQVFDMLGKPAKGKKCVGMEGIIEEGKEVIDMDAEPAVLDAALIASAQRVEHYEIAAYGTLRKFAEQLGFDDAAELLQQTLEEEEQADEKLTQIAESSVNAQAAQGAEEAGEADEEVAQPAKRSRSTARKSGAGATYE
jgi:ferritin-like metal-binding protein YciE